MIKEEDFKLGMIVYYINYGHYRLKADAKINSFKLTGIHKICIEEKIEYECWYLNNNIHERCNRFYEEDLYSTKEEANTALYKIYEEEQAELYKNLNDLHNKMFGCFK